MCNEEKEAGKMIRIIGQIYSDRGLEPKLRRYLLLFVLISTISIIWADDSRLRLELHTGLAKNTVLSDETSYLIYNRYPRIVGNFGAGIGYRLNDYLELYSFPHIKTRYVKNSMTYGTLSTRAKYIDVPLILRTKINNLEWGAGPSLALSVGTQNRRSGQYSNIQDSPFLIPGYVISGTIRANNNPNFFAHLYYRWDLIPFSESGVSRKTQESGGVSLGYTFSGVNPLIDLFPITGEKLDSGKRGTQAGISQISFGTYNVYMPNIRLEKISHQDGNWSLVRASSLGIVQIVEGYELVNLMRGTYQNQLSYRYHFLEPYIAPGIGAEAFFFYDSEGPQGPMDDERIRIYVLSYFILGAEAGCRFHLNEKLNLVLYIERSFNRLYNTNWDLGAGLSYRYMPSKKSEDVKMP